MSHPNERSLVEQAKAALLDDRGGDYESDPGFKTMQADVYAKLEIARQLGRVADELMRVANNVRPR